MSALDSAAFLGAIHSETLLRDLLDVSLTGIQVLRPVYAPDGTSVEDFDFIYTNPTGLRMIGLAQQPSGSILAQFPHALAAGIVAFYQQAFASDAPLTYETNYQADTIDNYLQFRARRSGEQLLVSFTDTSNQSRTVVEEALRDTQAQEQAARAEAEVQRQRFYDLLMQLPAQVAVHEGPDQVFTLVNAHYQRLAPGRTLQGQAIREAWPELVSQGILDVLDQVYDTGEPFIGKELSFQVDVTRTGHLEQLYVNAFFLPLRDARGQVSGVLDFSYDVTEQVVARQRVEQLNQELEARVLERTHAAEQALAEAERQRLNLVELVQQAPAAICVVAGPTFRYETFNPLYAEMFGGRPRVGRPMGEVLPEVVNHPSFLAFRAVYEEGRTFQQSEVLVQLARPGDGLLEDRYFSYTQQPRYDHQGQITGVFVFAVEVTPQVQARQQVERLNQELETRVQQRTQQAEAARAEAERQRGELERVFEQAPVAIAVYRGPTYTIELANPTVARLWGRTREQLIGQDLFEALPEVAGMGYEQLLDEVMATGVPFVAHAMKAQHQRNGGLETVYWDFVYVPVHAATGHINGAMVVATEVTAQVVARQQVEQLNTQLEARVQARTEELAALNKELHESNTQLTRTNVDLDTFVYTASHDLKAPITNIEGLLEALRHELPTDVQQQEMPQLLLGMIQGAIERFQNTIDQLTDVSRLQQAQNQPTEQVPLLPVIKDVLLDLKPLLLSTRARLTVDVSPAVQVLVSPKSLRSAVANLLSNALKYHKPGQAPVVLLRATILDGHAAFTVQDEGLGMNEHQLERLFGLFQRLHVHVEGSGVGLYMVKRLIENAGGTITVQSQEGVGTTFTVTLPTGQLP